MPKIRDIPPEDAVCIEHGCDYPATVTRPATEPWLYEGGIITVCDEWVCAYHGA